MSLISGDNMFGNFRNEFEIFLKNKDYAYFDSACMTLRPKSVVKKIIEYYDNYPVCAGRSSHKLGRIATKNSEIARDKIRAYLNARLSSEIIFTKNTTEAINIVANALDFQNKYIITTDKEHNSNFLPWVKTKELGRARLNLIKTVQGKINLDELGDFLANNDVRLVALNYASNLDGLINPVDEVVKLAHKHGALVLLDGAQIMAHKRVDVRKLNVDFFVFSVHKMFGPSLGVLYAKDGLLTKMNTFLVGGDTVSDVNYPDYKLLLPPSKFEAGLQNTPAILGAGAAVDFLRKNISYIEKTVEENLDYFYKQISKMNLELISQRENNVGIITVIPNTIDAKELSAYLDEHNIAVRAGRFCVHQWFNANNHKKAVRFSLQAYNTREDIDRAIKVLKSII
jgi:cysteine desulfurase/selenocysteine lyase